MSRSSGSKRLFIVADDFGYGSARNYGIVESYQQHGISAVSLLANCKHTDHAVALAKMHAMPVGLHFNITEGCPLSSPQAISSLVTAGGKFKGREGFWKNPSIECCHVEKELVAQIKWFKNAVGLLPHHVDGHQHVHVHTNVVKTFAKILKRYGINRTRVPYEDKASPHNEDMPLRRIQFHFLVNALAKKSLKIFRLYRIETCDAFIGLNFMGRAMTTQRLKSTLRSIYSRGVTSCELMVHPGYKSDKYTDGFINGELADDFSCSSDREQELAVLTSKEMITFYQEEGIGVQ